MLIKQGFSHNQTDPCLWSWKKDGRWTYSLMSRVRFWVKRQGRLWWHSDSPEPRVKVNWLGISTYYLGLKIAFNFFPFSLLKGKHKTVNLLDQISLKEAKGATTPGGKLSKIRWRHDSELLCHSKQYWEASMPKQAQAERARHRHSCAELGFPSRKTNLPSTWDWIAVKKLGRWRLDMFY